MSPLDDFSRYATIIPDEYLPALARNLKRIPDFTWIIGRPHEDVQRLQGDLLLDFPTVFLDEAGVPRSRQFTVMILNNTCDLPDGRLDFVTAAPVVDFNNYLEFERERRFRGKTNVQESEKRRIEDSLQEFGRVLRNNDKTEVFYLPPFSEFTHGALVLLHLVCSVSARLYHDALRQSRRVASFTQTGFYFLLIKLTTHLARAETTEVVRRENT
ncbi:MAG: hypothetical protein HY694_11535 [Deltaproteobacteria bacterium]|nr:hypothetical protein [Deltaproteobacteria bacterium]